MRRTTSNSQAKNLRLIGGIIAAMYLIYGALLSFIIITIIPDPVVKMLCICGIGLGSLFAAFMNYVVFNAAGELLEETRAISKSNIAIAKMLKNR